MHLAQILPGFRTFLWEPKKGWKFRNVQLELISRKSFGVFFWPFSWLGKNKRLVFNGMESSQIIVPGFVIHNFLVWVFRVKALPQPNEQKDTEKCHKPTCYVFGVYDALQLEKNHFSHLHCFCCRLSPPFLVSSRPLRVQSPLADPAFHMLRPRSDLHHVWRPRSKDPEATRHALPIQPFLDEMVAERPNRWPDGCLPEVLNPVLLAEQSESWGGRNQLVKFEPEIRTWVFGCVCQGRMCFTTNITQTITVDFELQLGSQPSF